MRCRRLFFEPLEDRRLLATITVNSLADNTTTDDGLITLREAIQAANSDMAVDGSTPGNGADTIMFDASLTSSGPATITLGGTQLQLTDDVTITGLGADQLVIDGDGKSRIFLVSSGVTARISGLTIANGNATGNGGGIFNEGTLTIDRSTVSGNTALSNDGGISNVGALTVTNSTISGNSAPDFGGGVGNNGGTLTITNTTISGNQAGGSGAGIWTNNATVLNHVTITNNLADSNDDGTGSGGGIFVGAGTPVVHNSIISGNHEQTSSSLNDDDVSGSLSGSSTYNLIGVGGGLSNGSNGNQVGVADPRLAAFGWYGGTTQTHALLADSTAIDAGDPARETWRWPARRLSRRRASSRDLIWKPARQSTETWQRFHTQTQVTRAQAGKWNWPQTRRSRRLCFTIEEPTNRDCGTSRSRSWTATVPPCCSHRPCSIRRTCWGTARSIKGRRL